MDENHAPPTWGQWLRATLGWDGCLPLIAASSRLVLPFLIDDKPLVLMIAVFMVPLTTALLRAHRGKRQLEHLVGRASVWRQVLLAAAILVLIIFEAAMGIIVGEAQAGLDHWLAAGTFYLVYLLLVAAAVWPARHTAS